MATRGVRLNRWMVFGWVAGAIFIVRQMLVVAAVAKLHAPTWLRIGVFLGAGWATRKSLLVAVVMGGLATLLAELVVRLIAAPIVQAWHTPRFDATAGLFGLEARETIVGTSPARFCRGAWRWAPGTLLRTDRRLWFIPEAWDAEPWERRLDQLEEVRLVPAPSVLGGLIHGLPDRLAVASLDGETALFALTEPDASVAWFPPSATPETATASRT